MLFHLILYYFHPGAPTSLKPLRLCGYCRTDLDIKPKQKRTRSESFSFLSFKDFSRGRQAGVLQRTWLRITVARAAKPTTGVCPPSLFQPCTCTYTLTRTCKEEKKTTCSFFLSRCESVNEHFEILWLRENHLNQFCLSTSVTLIPSSGSWQFWQLVLQRDGIQANKHLIIGSNNVLFSSHRRLIRVGVGWILTFRAVCRGRVGAATAIRIDYRLLPLSLVSCWSLWAALSQHVTRLPPPLHFLTVASCPMAHR